MFRLSRALVLSAAVAGLVNTAQAQQGGEKTPGLLRDLVIRRAAAANDNVKSGKKNTRDAQSDSRQVSSSRFGSGTITPTKFPDLAITRMRRVGSLIQVTVQNQGDGPSPVTAATVTVFPRTGNQMLARETQFMAVLSPGQTTTMAFHNLPISNARVFAFADPDRKVRERSENNNTAQLVIGDQSGQLPDLTVQRIASNRQGLIIDVRNQGRASSPVSYLRVAVRRKSDLNTILQRTYVVAGLGANHVANIQVPIANLADTDVFATVDPESEVRELNEGNNTKVQEF